MLFNYNYFEKDKRTDYNKLSKHRYHETMKIPDTVFLEVHREEIHRGFFLAGNSDALSERTKQNKNTNKIAWVNWNISPQKFAPFCKILKILETKFLGKVSVKPPLKETACVLHF